MTDTDALIEKVARAQFRFIVQSHGNEWVVFDRERQIAVENHANQLNALTATKPLNARAAAVAVLKEIREPSQTQLVAGAQSLDRKPNDPVRRQPLRCYESMIDALLTQLEANND